MEKSKFKKIFSNFLIVISVIFVVFLVLYSICNPSEEDRDFWMFWGIMVYMSCIVKRAAKDIKKEINTLKIEINSLKQKLYID